MFSIVSLVSTILAAPSGLKARASDRVRNRVNEGARHSGGGR